MHANTMQKIETNLPWCNKSEGFQQNEDVNIAFIFWQLMLFCIRDISTRVYVSHRPLYVLYLCVSFLFPLFYISYFICFSFFLFYPK